MIDSTHLLSTLQTQVKDLVDDLQRRVDDEPLIGDPLRSEYQRAFDAERTAWTFTEWAEDRLTQVAVGWLLACVFVRFCEDNGLLDHTMLAGDGPRGAEARAAQQDFFTANPQGSDRDFLHHVFRSAAVHQGLDRVVGEGFSPLWLVDPSADACTDLIAVFRSTDEDGSLVLEFTDPQMDTRFLGDLYQDLSEFAKKTYALLQTPIFVEEFILDRTLEPAIESHGLARTTLIDPTCGSGHFLLGAFDRLWQRWADAEPGSAPELLAQKALDAVWGVDLNPFAAAIARFRLLVAALRRCGISRLADARDFDIHVAVGDSLLWGARQRSLETEGLEDQQFLYATEDAQALRRTFGQQYAAVVGNPPYIVPRDPAANAAYRSVYSSCHRQYSLGVPFTELFFNLASPPDPATSSPVGQVGLITANSFMKREFGKKLIENHIPHWDVTHVVDTSGAYIPGHGTPTVIVLGRNQRPVANTIRAVMGVRGEPSTPVDPTKGLVWSSILDQVDDPGSESEFVSVADTERSRFAQHPWSIGGGGASELKDSLEAISSPLQAFVAAIGDTGRSSADGVVVAPSRAATNRKGVEGSMVRVLVEGERVRNFLITDCQVCLFPYSERGLTDLQVMPGGMRWLWPFRTTMGNRATFAKLTYFDEGRPWWEWHQVALDRLRTPLSIAFAFVATHNHFVLDRGGKVFKQSAPVIKLSEGASLDDHLGLLALLNSSVACFWMKQVFHNKGSSTDVHGARVSGTDSWDNSFEFDGTKLQQFPVAASRRPVSFGRRIDALASDLSAHLPAAVAAGGPPSRPRLDAAHAEADRLLAEMIAVQEELDWHCLHLYGVTHTLLTVPEGTEPPPLRLGERAFEIVLARRIAAGEVESAWFSRHRSSPVAELPMHWPDWYKSLVERRIDLIDSNRNVALVERPEHKRRWNQTPWEDLENAALRDWLLDGLEDRSLWFDDDVAIVRTVGQLADRVALNADWMEVARTWMGQGDVDAVSVVTKLVADEHVPAQAAARYKPSGLKKRAEWERTWDLQRAEDRGEDVGRIAVPPKYTSSDFQKPSYWKQRGKLDVPKERFVSVHSAERAVSEGDSTMVLAWAGFDHAELALALGNLIFDRQSNAGWSKDQLVPLLAALTEVLPWVEQWHPAIDPDIGQPLGVYLRAFVAQTLDTVGATTDDVASWAPPATTRGRKKAAASAADGLDAPAENLSNED
jgi:hypothetical protein